MSEKRALFVGSPAGLPEALDDAPGTPPGALSGPPPSPFGALGPKTPELAAPSRADSRLGLRTLAEPRIGEGRDDGEEMLSEVICRRLEA